MSQFRDLQKLRDTKVPSKQLLSTGRSSRLQKFKPQIQAFGANIGKQVRMPPEDLFSEPKKKGHRKGLSINGFTYYDKRQQMTPSPILSIYNYSIKLPKNQGGYFSNPVSSRDHPKGHDDDYQKYREYAEGRLLNLDLINKSLFKIYYVIGKGGFGKVWKVEMKRTGKIFAMKQMYKTKIIDKKSINSVMNQRSLLSKLKNPFIVNMSYAFQDRQNLYLVMDYLNGGDLRYHIGKKRRFSQTQTKFFIACLVMALQYLHGNKIIHRDVKPENLVLESNGYVRLTDLGISREFRQQNANDTSGTPGYMAPQVMCRKNHTFSVDFFALGVMGYQFMLGKRPYLGKNRKQIRDQILSKQAQVKQQQIPRNWSLQGADFINRLLIRNPHYRLGANGIDQVKQHPWLKNVDWARLQRKQLRSPYLPLTIEENYEEYKGQISEDTVVQNPQENALLLRDRQVQQLFEGYYFDFQKVTKKNKTTTNGSLVTTQITQTQGFNHKPYVEYSNRK